MGAIFSPDRQYRYVLRREVMPFDSGLVTFVMLNPSTADETADDPTIRRCMGFAMNWGYRALEVVNLFALRATDPKALKEAEAPVGPDNDHYIRVSVQQANLVVVAWGVHGAQGGRSMEVIENISKIRTPHHLGLTKKGEPKHPLYLPKNTLPMPYKVGAR